MRFALLGLCVLALGLAACAGGVNPANPCNPSNNVYGVAANPANPANSCNPSVTPMGLQAPDPCGLPVYGGSPCAPAPVAAPILAAPAPCPMPMAQSPCAPAPMAYGATQVPQGKCGALPPEAKPGETWCCFMVQPPAAAPQRVCIEQECQIAIPVPAVYQTRQKQVLVCAARTEWQQVDCGPAQAGQQECWKLVEIPAQYRTECYEECVQPASVRYETKPAKYEMVPGAMPPPFYEWRKTDCGVPMGAAAPCDFPPAAPMGSPDGN